MIFFYGNDNLKAQIEVKMVKNPQLCPHRFWLNELVWTLPEPHISTFENLHAKQIHVFSASLREKTPFFDKMNNFVILAQKIFFRKVLS